MKLLFINPCLRKGANTKMLPVGLASVMTYVDLHGYEFDLLDVDAYDLSDEDVENHIHSNQYDVYLFGSIVTHYKWVKWLTHTIRKYHPNSVIIVGNSVAGSCYEVFMSHAPNDITVIGEGEVTTVAVLDSIKNGTALCEVEGIAFRDGDAIRKTTQRKAARLENLPMVNWDYFDVSKYLDSQSTRNSFGADNNTVAMPVVTARGCAFRCTFCHFVFWDDPYRYRSPDDVLAEIRRNMERYGANYINFWDDLSFGSLPQAERMADAIIQSGLKFDWSAAVRTDLFGNPKHSYERRLAVARKMRESGCKAVGFSLESGNKNILDMMDKKINPDYFTNQIEVLRDVGIVSNTSVVFGYPIETAETIEETFDMCDKNRVYPSIGFLLPLPYTKMYEYAKEYGYITDEDAYLDAITERQDFCLNMTAMSQDAVMDHIKNGAERLNRLLKLNLDEGSYIRTGGYNKHTNKKLQLKKPLDPDNMKRNENDFSFNYSEAVFEIDQGLDEK
ncbi:MAG: radical SAM protein [Gammaproteobacteria bacterium]|nr:radical SAM protein [Gammaproteobacteria bacterium]